MNVGGGGGVVFHPAERATGRSHQGRDATLHYNMQTDAGSCDLTLYACRRSMALETSNFRAMRNLTAVIWLTRVAFWDCSLHLNSARNSSTAWHTHTQTHTIQFIAFTTKWAKLQKLLQKCFIVNLNIVTRSFLNSKNFNKSLYRLHESPNTTRFDHSFKPHARNEVNRFLYLESTPKALIPTRTFKPHPRIDSEREKQFGDLETPSGCRSQLQTKKKKKKRRTDVVIPRF